MREFEKGKGANFLGEEKISLFIDGYPPAPYNQRSAMEEIGRENKNEKAI